MVNFDSTIELLKKLPDRERIFVESFVEFLNKDEDLLNRLAEFLATKVSDQELRDHLKNLAGELKIQACVEYLVISLVSGDIKVKEVAALVKE